MKKKIERWGWAGNDGLQTEVFNSPNEAIEAMCKRLGQDNTLTDIEKIGFRLAQVQVTLEVLFIMTPAETHKD